MHLNPYGEYAVLMAASLANDWPADRAGIEARAREFGMRMQFPHGRDDHPQVRKVIDDWLTVVDADDPRERARILNRHMASATAYPRLTDHDDQGWHLHYRDDDAKSLAHVLSAVISVGTALHLTTRGMHRLGRCAAGDPCSAVVVDITRSGRQQYCSVRCANRAAVRRHRARAAAG
ncbi:CGNR zinc finger domain-containing protein [Calidifontibacter sp. DB0510]|uniref:CGNR zinc finger domain-containing protein n=1 Tax=Metallococcus carri TaxID=1656884 RepID=A0A967B5X1_9MICO|nr:CGNR zinc finger domain-containing protein [Metallococcus carri]NHN56187.1 CGNR zinc finger domain-containing protein [Metallococcus carri]NOP38762.1 CGNR zinc finger domain-containing protein [Calidifontibacter sp. DB2511S]